MIKSIELLSIRVLSFIMLIYQLLVINDNKSIVCLLFLLIFIINNNLRIFYLKNDTSKIFSIIIELICVNLMAFKFGGNMSLYLIGSTIDIFVLKSKHIRNVLEFIILILSTGLNFNNALDFIIVLAFLILLNYISRLYGLKVSAQELYDKLRVSEEKLLEANNELEEYANSIEEITLLKERNRISREIHDSVGHALSTTIIQLSAMEAIAGKEKSSLEGMISNLKEFVNESFQDVKRAVRELKPDEYNNYQGILRIQDVCKNFEKMTGVSVKVNISKADWTLSTKQVSEVYRITQECLANSLKHGKATVIKVIMNFTENEFIISFNDNGTGTEEIVESGVGLKSIKERSAELNGTSYFKSSIGKGFFVKIIIPKEVEV